MDGFDHKVFLRLHEEYMRKEYPGFRGPGSEKPDTYAAGQYSYTHIAAKYLREYAGDRHPGWQLLQRLVDHAREQALWRGVNPKYWPTEEDSTLRLLQYPPEAVIAPHYDFNLFTLPLWRSNWDHYHVSPKVPQGGRGMHVGEIGEQVGMGPATEHWTTPTHRWSWAAVFFAMPPLDVTLPSGQTVSEWLAVRKGKSRG